MLEVNSDGAVAEATALAGTAKRIYAELEKERKLIVADPNEFVKAVNSKVRELTDPCKRIEEALKRKMNAYTAQVELERRKREAAERKAAEEAQRKINEAAKAAGVEAPKIAQPVTPAKREPTRTELGTSYITKWWTYEVEDPAAVPREYLAVNEKAIGSAVKNGVRSIPGVKIYEKSETRIRR